MPTLVLACDGSHVDLDSQRYISDRIRDAWLHVFPTEIARFYFPFLENLNVFNEVVASFVAEVTAD